MRFMQPKCAALVCLAIQVFEAKISEHCLCASILNHLQLLATFALRLTEIEIEAAYYLA